MIAISPSSVGGDASSVADDEVAFIVVRRRHCRHRDRENEGFGRGKWMDGRMATSINDVHTRGRASAGDIT